MAVQSSIDEFATKTAEPPQEPIVTLAKASDTDGGKRTCVGCGAFVTAEYARVLGDNEDRVHSCPACGPTGRRA